MSVSQNSKGTTLSVTISAAITAIPGVTAINVPTQTRAEIDTTDLDSTAKEYILDIPDGGEVSFTLNLKKATSGNGYNATQTYLETAEIAQSLEVFTIHFPQYGVTYTFSAFVKTFAPDAAVGKAVTASVVLRVSGATTKTIDS